MPIIKPEEIYLKYKNEFTDTVYQIITTFPCRSRSILENLEKDIGILLDKHGIRTSIIHSKTYIFDNLKDESKTTNQTNKEISDSNSQN